jgi:diguanylate cyclase (GGDEF)-like protein
MFGISKKTAMKAGLAAVASALVSLSAALIVVPMLGGHPDGPGFWMSLVCPLVIAWPASAFQFHQHEKLIKTRDQLATAHSELDFMHSKLMRTHAILAERSRHDAMTGALNRETFFAALQDASREDRPSALLIADADHFKRINDTYGHRFGDAALGAIAGAVKSVLRPEDFWGRIGGEEFALYLEGVSEMQAGEIGEAVRKAAEATELKADGDTISVTLSLGGIWLPSRFDATLAMTEADDRLYIAKRSGRNMCIFGRDGDDRESSAA